MTLEGVDKELPYRLKVATIERTQRKDRSWMKGRIEQELDVLVHQVGEELGARGRVLEPSEEALASWTVRPRSLKT